MRSVDDGASVPTIGSQLLDPKDPIPKHDGGKNSMKLEIITICSRSVRIASLEENRA
ncbi:hypothetical protein [Chamaesiphon sp.]|uniref:hypothetical protein n=1 Tax=Chamaesiphon sp. TaxID=2814140 RepID=UPI003593BC2E